MDYEEEIRRREEQITRVEPRMNEVRKRFISHFATHLRSLYGQLARSQVECKSDLTLSLDDARLAKMKQDVLALVDSAETIAAEYLDKDALWWIPTGEHGEFHSVSNQSKAAKTLEESMRLAVGRLGPILESYGYVSTNPQADRNKIDVWCEWDSSGNHYKPGGRPRYPYALDWSEQIKQDLVEYTTVATEVEKLRSEIRQLRSDWDKTKAKSKWDGV